MKLLLLAFGSRGDVQPLLPLAAGLTSAGYEVQISAGTNFRGEIEGRGFEFVDVGVDIAEFGALIRQETGVANAVKAVNAILGH